MGTYPSFKVAATAFINGKGQLVKGLTDYEAFAKKLQDVGKFGIKDGGPDPKYVPELVWTITRISANEMLIASSHPPFRRLCLRVFIALMALTACGQGVHAQQRISKAEAIILVHEALKATGSDSPRVVLSKIDYPHAADFYAFDASWPNPEGSPEIGAFGVNPWTGEVWKLVVCELVDSRRLRRHQLAIRRRFHLKQKHYDELRDKTPAC